MHPDVVVDVGNSRIKWGRCAGSGIGDAASLAPDDPSAWAAQLQKWRLTAGTNWVVSGVAPLRRDSLIRWLESEKQIVHPLASAKQLPLVVKLEHPDRIGIDRLLNGVAANTRREAGRAAVIVDAGSAVTVDYVDSAGAFRGGAIFPGLRLMAQALNSYTALLPFVEISGSPPPLPATSTTSAIEAGMYWAVVGGIRALVAEMTRGNPGSPMIFLTGGDADILAPALETNGTLWPQMTLEGIRIAACTMTAT